MKKTSVIMALISVLWSGCSSLDRNHTMERDNNNKTSNSLVKDIPLDGYSSFVSGYVTKNEIVKILNLDSLETGSDSIRIRIWCHYAFKDSFQIITLKYIDKSWAANIYLVMSEYNENHTSFEKFITTKRDVKPRSDWTKFIKDLYELEIKTLPDMDRVYNNINIADGDVIVVEISDRRQYRYYRYQEPEQVKERVPEAKKMVQILNLIESELDFKRLN